MENHSGCESNLVYLDDLIVVASSEHEHIKQTHNKDIDNNSCVLISMKLIQLICSVIV